VGNSLQDQLLNAGLVDRNRLQQSKKQRHKQVKGQRGEVEQQRQQQQQRHNSAQAEKMARDRELNAKRQQQQQRQAQQAEIRQLIAEHKLNRQGGEVRYHFQDGTQLKQLYVTEALQQQLGRGQAGIVKQGGRYEVVMSEIAERIAARDALALVLLNTPTQPASAAPTAEAADPYARYEIPDDLMW